MSEQTISTIDLDLDDIEAKAIAAAQAVGGDVWEAWQTSTAETEVSVIDKQFFGTVASPSRRPEDYGKASGEYIATVDPATVLELIRRLRDAEERAKPPF